MAMTSRTRSSRGGKRTPTARPTARARARTAATSKAAAPDVARGAKRVCEAPGCGKAFRAYVARQRFCSNGCRSRAFYWDFKEKTGERYAAHLSGDGAAARKAPARSRARRRRA